MSWPPCQIAGVSLRCMHRPGSRRLHCDEIIAMLFPFPLSSFPPQSFRVVHKAHKCHTHYVVTDTAFQGYLFVNEGQATGLMFVRCSDWTVRRMTSSGMQKIGLISLSERSPRRESAAMPKSVWKGSTMSPGRSEKPPVSPSWHAMMNCRSWSASIQCMRPMIRRDVSTHLHGTNAKRCETLHISLTNLCWATNHE